MADYPHLFTPIQVGKLTLPNRIIMGSMHTRLEEIAGLERLTAFFIERVLGGCSLIITGGFSPNVEGQLSVGAATFDGDANVQEHRRMTNAIHTAGGHIILQILHSGRYGRHDNIVAPSPVRSPINRETPRQMTSGDIQRTIEDFAAAAALAQQAGYDGVEIMGSEGYLISQFVAPRTNHRDDVWGGNFKNRIRLPIEIVRRTRAWVSADFIIMYRLSVLDLVEDGPTEAEIISFARAIEAAGATLINSGIGWHEAKVPTIAQAVPTAAFTSATAKLMGKISIPLIAANRINTPEIAEAVLAAGDADMVSLARAFLADPDFVTKAEGGRRSELNVCIACNQACLDHIFSGRLCSCLVNPRACHETEIVWDVAETPRRIAVVGAGPAGMAAASVAAERGHYVTLFDSASEIGGQFTVARQVPGKAVFDETLRYFRNRLQTAGVVVRLKQRAAFADLADFNAVVLATGVTPRRPPIDGIEHPMVTGYLDVLCGRSVGHRVAIIGGGGIAFDVALYLLADNDGSVEAFRREWRLNGAADENAPRHDMTMLQRSDEPMGHSLGKTTGWIHKAALKQKAVRQVCGVIYRQIDDAGLHTTIDGEDHLIEADTVIVCAGQESLAELFAPLRQGGIEVHLIGGALKTSGLDAKRAIEEGIRLAAML